MNVASIIGFTGYSGLAVYGATKASMLGFTRSLAREVGRIGVNVNSVAPGFIDTEMTHGLKDEQRQQIIRRSALKRLAEIDDVANAVEFCWADKAKNITGMVLTVDAGKYGMNEQAIAAPARSSGSAAKAWARALELTAPSPGIRSVFFAAVIQNLAGQFGDTPALLSDRECLTYRGLVRTVEPICPMGARSGYRQRRGRMPVYAESAEYMAIWLGITQVGGVVALLNTNLTGPSLAHCINLVAPKHIIVATELIDGIDHGDAGAYRSGNIWAHGAGQGSLPRIDREIERYSGKSVMYRG